MQLTRSLNPAAQSPRYRPRGSCALRLLALAALLALAYPAFAHPISAQSTGGGFAQSWSFEPAVLTSLLLSAALYLAGARRRQRRGNLPPLEALAFAGGWLTLVAALVSPLHEMGEMLFCAHMTQHELLLTVAAPLLVVSRPLVTFLWALPLRWREVLGAWAKLRPVSAAWRTLTGAMFAWLLHGATLWLWHIPVFYQASVENEAVHALQHTTFLATALLFWWTLLHGHFRRSNTGMAVIYVFTTAVHTSILGGLMTFASRVWYPIYEGRTTVWHITALEDQQIGGLIMWIPAGVIFLAIGLWLVAAWMRESERRVAFTQSEALAAGGRDAP